MKQAIVLAAISLLLYSCSEDSTDIPRDAQQEYAETFPDPDGVVTTSYSSSILEEYSIVDGKLTIVLKEPNTHSDYFESGDKLNKLFAIETMRLFYKIPDITAIEMTTNIAMGNYHLNVSKDQIQEFYGIRIDSLREFQDTGQLMIGDRWRNDFLSRFDSKNKRAEFAQRFVKK